MEGGSLKLNDCVFSIHSIEKYFLCTGLGRDLKLKPFIACVTLNIENPEQRYLPGVFPQKKYLE